MCALVLLSSAPGRSNATLGQASALIVALTLADLFLVSGRRRGYLLGCAIAIKLTPLAFVPLLLLVGRRRQALIASVTAAVLTGAALLADPRQSAHYGPVSCSSPADSAGRMPSAISRCADAWNGPAFTPRVSGCSWQLRS